MPLLNSTNEILQARSAYNEYLTESVEKKRSTWLPVALLAVLLAFPAVQFFGNFNYVIHLLLFTAMYVVLAAGWNILGGFSGYTSLGHNVFFAIGGYFAGMIFARHGVPIIFLVPFAGLAAGIVGYLNGLITLRVSGPSFMISTIAFLMIAHIALKNWQFAGGAGGVILPNNELPVEWAKLPYYYAFVVMAAFTVWSSYRIKHSKFGLGLRAISKDETKAESAGIDTRLYKLLAFAISAFFVGMAGAVWGGYISYVRPNIFLAVLISVNMVLMCILGGLGTIAGPVVGAILLVAVNELVVATLGASEINVLASGLVMLACLMVFPLGIVGTLAKHKRLPRLLNWD